MRFAAVLLLVPFLASAAPIVPEPLKPWVPWVLHKHEADICPTPFGAFEKKLCHWPSRLDVKATRTGATFTQNGVSFAPGWLVIPGDEKHWPFDVRLDGKTAVVVPRGERPSIYASPGAFRISGSFRWDTLPESLAVPQGTGLVALAVGGKTMAEPDVDEEGQLWFQRSEATESGDVDEENVERDIGSAEDIRVYRRVVDEIPLQLETRIELKVSGQDRKLTLGPVLPAKFVPLSVEGELPARLERDGRLSVQARAGRWQLTVRARHEGPVTALSVVKATALWPSEEAWVFEARPALRLVTVEGVSPLDPQQTTIPSDWRRLPAYRMASGTTMTLVARGRGVDESSRDELGLGRQLWLDFDGGGFSVRDDLRGTVKRAWRLEMQPPLELGRVGGTGGNQLITKGASGLSGFEVRETALNVDVDSRLPRNGSKLPAVGWNHDFQKVSAVVNLPPGWKAWAATGVDVAHGTWMSRWNLATLFLVLLVALSLAKLKGPRFALFGGAVLALTVPETDAPRWLWVAVLVTLTLAKVLPEGRFKAIARFARAGAFASLALVVLMFVHRQVRTAIYPTLEKPWAGMHHAMSRHVEPAMESGITFGAAFAPPKGRGRPAANEAGLGGAGGDLDDELLAEEAPSEMEQVAPAPSAAAPDGERDEARKEIEVAKKKVGRAGAGKSFSKLTSNAYSYSQQNVQRLDPNAVVQVGRGLPRWQWNQVQLGWSGPVTKNETLRLFLAPPWLAGPIAVLQALLVALLALLLASYAWGADPRKWRPRAGAAKALFVAGLLAAHAAAPTAVAETMPSNEMLGELRTRLLQKAECYPSCAAAPRVRLEYGPRTLTVRLEVHAAVDTAVPLPGMAKQWIPSQISVDGRPAEGVRREDEGELWLFVKKGEHQVLLSGALPERDTVQLPLRLSSHNVSASGTGWTVEGIHKDGQAAETLELRRSLGRAAKTARASFEASQLPPFVTVDRELALGLTWNVRTRVVRQSPSGTAIVLAVPLLAGESVTTPGFRTEKGKALVNLGARDNEVTWDSILEPKSPLKLVAPSNVGWIEVWRFDASPLWSVAFEGIPRVVDADDAGRKVPVWRPWPGESLQADITRPKAAEGQTLSLPMSYVDVRPGTRLSDVGLTFELTSSRGGEHSITLPEAAELQSVHVDGELQPLRADKGKLTLPVAPSTRKFDVKWREPAGLHGWYRTPAIDLGVAGTNASLEVRMPEDRWILWVGGPRMGPAVLVWGELVVLLLAAWLLGRFPGSPLRMREWMLLGVGLTQIELSGKLILVGFFLAFGWREKRGAKLSRGQFNAMQLGLGALSIAALACLFAVLQNGFFGDPAMHVAGNQSSTDLLRWFADLSPGPLPRAFVISLPLWCYRVAMLLWALWLAMAVLRWSKWAWDAFSEGGLWKKRQLIKT